MKSYTFTEKSFHKTYPTNEDCLHELYRRSWLGKRCPKCNRGIIYHKIKNRMAYQCSGCSHQIYPTVGTIFENSKIPLKQWFYIIFLHTTTRNGISAKFIERILGVDYKTALRMSHRIKGLMMDTETRQLKDYVMIDECYFGQKSRTMHSDKRKKFFSNGLTNKTTVMGFMEKNGYVHTKVLGQEEIPSPTYRQIVIDTVNPDAVLITDAFPAYKNLVFSFPNHVRVDHTKGEYVKDGHSTNPLENYWSTLKRMIKGTYIHVSPKHLSKYIGENTFRYVHRKEPEKMFDLILQKIRR